MSGSKPFIGSRQPSFSAFWWIFNHLPVTRGSSPSINHVSVSILQQSLIVSAMLACLVCSSCIIPVPLATSSVLQYHLIVQSSITYLHANLQCSTVEVSHCLLAWSSLSSSAQTSNDCGKKFKPPSRFIHRTSRSHHHCPPPLSYFVLIVPCSSCGLFVTSPPRTRSHNCIYTTHTTQSLHPYSYFLLLHTNIPASVSVSIPFHFHSAPSKNHLTY